MHCKNARNYLYVDAFNAGYCKNPCDVNCVAYAIQGLIKLFASPKFSTPKKAEHLTTLRRQTEEFVETLFLLTPENVPFMTIGTPRDWFFYLRHTTIATAIIILRVLLTHEHAARGGDASHRAADMIWAELVRFMSSRYNTMDLHKTQQSTFAKFPIDILTEPAATFWTNASAAETAQLKGAPKTGTAKKKTEKPVANGSA